MNIIVFIIFGAIVGWIASMITKRNGQQGAIGNIVVGILGAFLGGFIMSLFNAAGVTGFDLRSFLVALMGAVILLAIYNAIRRRTHAA